MSNNINNSDKKSVLFVCLGNICRSPLAEGVFVHLIKERGLDSFFTVDSCGTSAYHKGEPPHSESQRVARHHGIDISGQKSRPLRKSDYEDFDLIVAMDKKNRADLESAKPEISSKAKIISLRQFENGSEIIEDYLDVPDPYFGGSSGFDLVYNTIYCCSVNLLDWCQREYRIE